MNRSIALFVALVLLLAHVLTIHTDARGLVAVAWDQSHAAFRLGRNLVHEGQLAWTPGMEAFESTPNTLWTLLCAAFEFLAPVARSSVNGLAQTVGIVCALAATIVVSRIRPHRSAGLMAPLVLAASGAYAAAAASGWDTTLYALLLAGAFLALERGRTGWTGLLLSIALLARPDALVFVVGFAAVRAFGRQQPDTPRAGWGAFVAPAATFAAVAILRTWTTGHVLPSSFAPWLDADEGQREAGFALLRAFALSTAVPLLLAWPLFWLVRGRLSHTGAHAAFLACLWLAAEALRGGGSMPFYSAFVPALPFLAIAAQEGLVVSFDSPSKLVRRAGLAALALALGGSVLASKTPGDIGPLPLGRYYEALSADALAAQHGSGAPLGRLGLHEEIGRTIRLRKLGHYLRYEPAEGSSVLSPWPGAVGYISRKPVHDLLGRTDPLHPGDTPRAWPHPGRADTVAALRAGYDYVVPGVQLGDALLSPAQLARDWLAAFDAHADEPGRLDELRKAFEDYELLIVRYGVPDRSLNLVEVETLHLLRKRSLGRQPRLGAQLQGEHLEVDVLHNAESQLADLQIELLSAGGKAATLRPTGEAELERRVCARTRVLLYSSGQRQVRLWDGDLPPAPAGDRWASVRIRLRNPFADEAGAWADSCRPLELAR